MRRIDDLLQRFLDSVGSTDGSHYIGLFRGWRSIVGDRLADHARPVDVRGRSLVIEADHPGWVQLVMMMRGRIIREVQRRFPQIPVTGITVRTVAETSPDRRTAQSPHARAVPPHESRETGVSEPPPPVPPTRDDTDALGRIADEEMRDSLRRLREALTQTGEERPSQAP